MIREGHGTAAPHSFVAADSLPIHRYLNPLSERYCENDFQAFGSRVYFDYFIFLRKSRKGI
jgi:hypothetical protein